MSIKINNKYIKQFVSDEEYEAIVPEVEAALETVKKRTGEGSDFLGWYTRPVDYDKDEYARIKIAAKKIQSMCEAFIVIGIGGSYLGTRAALDFIKSNHYNNLPKDTPDIYFAGYSLSSSHLADILAVCETKDVCINVVSKSGTTTEPAVAFRVIREFLENKYGKEEAAKRIFVTTDKAKGKMKELSDRNGYETFVIPDDIGGRYSVLTAVGLLPLAVAGVNTDSLLEGAEDAMNEYKAGSIKDNPCLQYAAYRNVMYRKGKVTEMLVVYEPFFRMFCEWWKQLYGESEGKDGKGLLPASVIFSTDLHSLGQYIQDGLRNMFETVVDIKESKHTITVPHDPENAYSLNYLSGMSFNRINHRAMNATLFAHVDGDVPNLVIEVPNRSEYSFGQLVYFFELACAISGYTLGVNPFNQPGVEAYKKNMFALLGKPDPALNELKKSLADRMAQD